MRKLKISIIYRAEKMINDVSPSDKIRIEALISRLKSELAANNTHGVKRAEEELTMSWYRGMAMNKNLSQYNESVSYIHTGDYEQAERIFKKLAGTGHVFSNWALGLIYAATGRPYHALH